MRLTVLGRCLLTGAFVAVILTGPSAPGYGVTNDFHSEWVEQSPYPTLAAGETTSYSVRYRNTGTATWRRGVPGAQVNLGVAGDSRAAFDAGLAVNWISADRIATTTEKSVAPGAIGTFTFALRAPSTPGSYRVTLRLVADGVTWLDDQGVHLVLVSDHGFRARWVGQSAHPTARSGDPTPPISITFRNTGTRTFVRGAAGQQLNLGVQLDDESWAPDALNWISANRVATTVEDNVPPGASATFVFSVRAPATAGAHVLRLRPVVDGVGWLEDQGVHVVITTVADGAAVLAGAGDVATCEAAGDEATAALLDRIAGTVVTLGDNAYERGSGEDFERCYGPSWGRHRARTRPALGNHEYETPAAAGHFAYFGPAAGDPGRGYYSYELGAWHVVVLNSNCGSVGGCGVGSAQEQWLRADLEAHPTRCTVAYWHHPLYTSEAMHAPAADMRELWRALYEAGAELVLSAHNHHYERFAPLDPVGRRDDARGIRSFIVGTGGAELRPVAARAAHSEVLRDDTHGVLKLVLSADRFEWEFVPIAGKTFSDRGAATCH